MDSALNETAAAVWFAAYAPLRPEGYALLASLLEQSPSKGVVELLQNLQWDDAIPGRLDRALGRLRQTARQTARQAAIPEIQAEFNRLFVGMGYSDLVPYASWYRERMIQSAPLASLRADLMRLGIVRRPDSSESEDHAGALCEVMALICGQRGGVPHAVQAEFFERHVASWLGRFFRDLRLAKSAQFYRAVATVGHCFLETEGEYLNVNVNLEMATPKGGLHHEKGKHRQPACIH